VEYKECHVKSVLSKSKIYGVDYAVNPYHGCEHACTYCYARFILELRGEDPTKWGETICAKINAPSLLKREIVSVRRGLVLLSSVTDPYQPLEKKYNLTRRILEILFRYHFPITILTKSDLVLRDIDLIKKFKEAEVGLTITMLNEEICSIFEPNAPKVSARLNALKILSKEVNTYAFIGPFIPIFSERDIEYLIEELSEIGVGRILFDKLNLKARNWITINNSLRKFDLDVSKEFWKKTRNMEYWSKIKRKIEILAYHHKIHVDFCY